MTTLPQYESHVVGMFAVLAVDQQELVLAGANYERQRVFAEAAFRRTMVYVDLLQEHKACGSGEVIIVGRLSQLGRLVNPPPLRNRRRQKRET